MKVKIIGHTGSDAAPWWYVDIIGKVFDVVEDEGKPQYYLVELAGSEHLHHILKVDCEVIE